MSFIINSLIALLLFGLGYVDGPTKFVERINVLSQKIITIQSTPSPSPSVSPAPTKSYEDLQYENPNKVLNDNAGYQCPSVVVINSWIKRVLKDKTNLDDDSVHVLFLDNKLLWACLVVHQDQYGALNEELRSAPTTTVMTTVIPTASTENTNKILNSLVKHHACSQDGKCLLVEGEGSDECSIDKHCWHSECKDLSCVAVLGRGENKCTADYTFDGNNNLYNSQCAHVECRNMACVAVSGKGENTCDSSQLNMDCYHYVCSVKTAGKGENTYTSDPQCKQ